LGRRSLAEKFYEDAEENDEEEGTWLVLYDFKGIKSNSKFWTNLDRVKRLVGGGTLIQYSVFMTTSKRGAITALKLARHYGADTILYRAELIEI